MRAWLAARPKGDGPLFAINGKFSEHIVIKYLSKALSDSGYTAKDFSGHSFRRGAATWADSIGMTSAQIQTLGRWNSDCFRLYIDAGPAKTVALGTSMLNTSTTKSNLPPNGVPAPDKVWRLTA